MNRFRVNLHPALFNIDKPSETPQEQLEEFTKADLENLKGEVLQDVSWKKRDRITSREKEQNDSVEGKTNDEIWTKNVTEWYGRLITTLRENHYFDGKNEEEQREELKKIKQMYEDEVKKQYKKVVWKKSDKKFDKVDQNLFDKDSPNSPANKIYTELTWVSTISSVDRQYTEWYDVNVLDENESSNSAEEIAETEIDKNNRKFLSNDLPQYLWDVRKTPWILNVMKWLPIFSVKTDRPSEVDRDAISDFIKAANRIPTKNGKSPVMVLLESLHDNTLNTNSTAETYIAVLEKHWMDKEKLVSGDNKQFKKCISSVMEVWNFYINTQKANIDVKDQHAIYLSVLGIIEDSKWAENAVNKFRERVEQSKLDKKKEKKEWYTSGEKLWETNPKLYWIAKSLWITDFASATRLSELGDEYFSKTPVEKILANLNNDNIIDARDAMAWWLKTWSQFLETFKQVSDQLWKEKALSNLVNHAKLVNKTLWVGLPDVLLNPKTIESDIKWGRTWIILLLQNIISNPGEDLYTLLSGRPENPFEWLDLAKESESAKKYASEMISKMDLEALKKEGLTLPTSESMQSDLAGVLFEEYKRWIWLWGKVSFDQWIKWVEMNTWFQIRDGGNVVVWIWLDYHKKIDLWKWWSTTPELSAWVFIPLWYWKPDVTGAIGLNDEVAKERITKKWVQQKLGMQAWVTLLIPTGTPVASVWLSWGRNKAARIEYRESELRWEMQGKMKTILKEVEQNMWNSKILNFTKAEVVSLVEDKIRSAAKDSWVKEKDINTVVNTTKRLLINYNGANLSDENVRDIIATKVADQYAMARSEARKAHISKSTYLSWANLGAFWVVGAPLVWVYAWLKRTDHDLDGYGDKLWETHTIDNSKRTEENGVRDVESLKSLNTRLGLTENQGLVFSKNGNEILIPNSMLSRIKVSESMKKFLVKDTNGNVSISPWTTMGESIVAWAATQSRELLIGESKDKDWNNLKFVPLDTVEADWFTQNIQEVNKKILTKENVEKFYTNKGILGGIEKLKAKNLNNRLLQSFNPTQEEIDALIGNLGKLSNKDKKAKIIIEREIDWKFRMRAEEWDNEWKWLELEYRAKLEMFDYNARELADKVYKRAATLEKPEEIRALYSVKHPIKQKHEHYDNFVNYLLWINNVKDLNKAKWELKEIINGVNKVLPDGKNLDISEIEKLPDNALEQALLSFNNLFARSTKVIWAGQEENLNGINKYKFTQSMWSIVEKRETEIGTTLDGKINWDENVKSAYRNLMKAMNTYRMKNPKNFETTTAKAAHLDNAVWFNLWDQNKPENPLFNPEIYEAPFDLKGILADTDKEILHKRAMENFISQPALFNPIKEVLSLQGEVNLRSFKNWEWILDIWDKKIKIKSDLVFGYFTQCVNHTVILENIKLEDDKWNAIPFTTWAWENGKYVEWNKSSVVSTTEVGVSASMIVHNGNKPEQPEVEEGDTEMGWGKVPNTPDTTPVITEYDENGNPINPADPETSTTTQPPVAPNDDSWVSTGGGWRKRN